MKRRCKLTDEAADDLDLACAWYEGERKGLGVKFNKAVRATLTKLERIPEAHAKIHGDVRRARVKGFKYYVLHYVVEPTWIDVISVFHTSRNPNVWQSRI